MIFYRGCHTVLLLITTILIKANTEELTFKQTLKKENSIFKELHQILMPYFWILFSNALIYFVGLRHKQNFYLYHGILFSLIIIITIATSFPVLLQQGLFRRPFHYILGVILWCLMIAQLIVGGFQMLIKRGYLQDILSLDLYHISRLHKFLGITIYIFTKISIIQRFKKHPQNLIAFIIWQICFLIFLYWRRSNSNINDLKMIVQSLTSIQKVNNLKQLNLSNIIVGLYLNYIFDIKNLEQVHPGGNQMIRQIHLKSFDKYIYGIQSLYKTQSNHPHEHSKHCFSLLKQPIAILDIKSPYNFGFQETISKVKVSSILKLSQNLFEIRLKKVEGFQFEYSGYCSLNQFGRFYTIQDENKLCRLYTAVNFLTYKNTEYLKNHKFYKFNGEFQQNVNNQMESIDTIALYRNQELSILIKRYENGRFTSNVQEYKDKYFNISKQCGEGLGLENVQSGHIIVFVGGTGIFPFCDLIDILYQNHVFQQQKSKSKQYLTNKSLIEKHLNTFSFEFYGSFKKIQDIHYITANQIAYLSKNSDKFSFLYNLDIHPTTECMNALNIRLTQEKFQNIVARDNFKSQFSKIYVCGPYKLNKKLYKSLSSKFSSEKYQIL